MKHQTRHQRQPARLMQEGRGDARPDPSKRRTEVYGEVALYGGKRHAAVMRMTDEYGHITTQTRVLELRGITGTRYLIDENRELRCLVEPIK